MKLCTVPECERTLKCAGLCSMHYFRMRRHGTLELPGVGLAPVLSRLGAPIAGASTDPDFWNRVRSQSEARWAR